MEAKHLNCEEDKKIFNVIETHTPWFMVFIHCISTSHIQSKNGGNELFQNPCLMNKMYTMGSTYQIFT